MKIIYVDTEYRKNDCTWKYNGICASFVSGSGVESFDLRGDYKEFRRYCDLIDLDNTVIAGYNISGAECQLFYQYLNKDWMLKSKWLDLWTEFKMLRLTHSDVSKAKGDGLLYALEYFKIPYTVDKEGTREIILGNTTYTDEQYTQIVKYCEEDTKVLPMLAKALSRFSRYGITLEHRLQRGEYCKIVAMCQQDFQGLQVDKELTSKVYENRVEIKNKLSERCNEVTKFEIFKPKYVTDSKKVTLSTKIKIKKDKAGKYSVIKGKEETKTEKTKILTKYGFCNDNFEEYIKSVNLYGVWKKTEKSNRLLLEDEYLDEMVSMYRDILAPFYHTRNTLKQLSSRDLREIMDDRGNIRPDYWPYHQKTSRTSPKPKQGFILNLSPWLRMLIRPEPGEALVGIDYKSQEVLVAAALSRDSSMLEDYLTDIYLGQGKKTGFIVEEATKKTHGTQRDSFKPITLGVFFGMMAKSLSIRFFNFWKDSGETKSIEDCLKDAERFLLRMRKAYPDYYAFLERNERLADGKGIIFTKDFWAYFITEFTKSNSKKNLPMQGNGAAVLRKAQILCYKEGIAVVPHHDAFYFRCKESDALRLGAIVSRCMVEASIEILGELGRHMGTEAKVYTHDLPYYDKRGKDMFDFVCKELSFDNVWSNGVTKHTEYKDLHKEIA